MTWSSILSSAVKAPPLLCLGVFISRWFSCLSSSPPPLLTLNPAHLSAGQPETFPLHTDNMLGTLCSLLAALTCVSSVIVLTQPSVVTLTRGESASIDCNMQSVTRYSARWYKQIPGGVPQYVLQFHKNLADVKYGSGFSSPHFTSTCTKVIVTGSSLPPPVLTFYRPSTNPLSSSHAALVCLARQMSIGFAEVSWLVNGRPVTEGTWTSTAVQHPDKTFQLSSHLSLRACDFSDDRSYTSGQPETFPLHTDNMLGTLCSLLAALTCTKVIVTGSSLPPPVLTFYRPSTNLLSSSYAALVCLARQMSIGFTEVSWLVNGSPVTEGTWTSTAVQHPDKTFQLSSYLSLPGCDSEDRSYTCKVTVGSSSFEKTMRMSESGQPETFPLHTDNMLGTLCSLLAALTCVSSVIVLTQPSVVTLTRGESASIDCNMQSVIRDFTTPLGVMEDELDEPVSFVPIRLN
ncbi:unnamed protein product [Arctogadus glacialis]